MYGYALALCLAAGVAGLASLGAPAVASAEGCPNAAFRVGPSAHLPDCRAYELVTPPYKNAGELAYKFMSPDGSTLLMVPQLTGGFSGAGADPAGSVYAMTRTEAGWSTVSTEPPRSEYASYSSEGVGFGDFAGVSLDARTTLYTERGPGRPGNSIDLYRREASGAIADVGSLLPPTAPFGVEINFLGGDYGLEPRGLSADGSRAFFARERELYEYVGVGNTTPMPVGVSDAGEVISQCQTALGGPEGTHNAVSLDGRTVFFTAVSDADLPSQCAPSLVAPRVSEVYARVGNGGPGARTVAVSEPSVEDCAACDTGAQVRASAEFLGASGDGSKVFFTTRQPLLGGDVSENVYEYDFGAPAGQRIVRVSGGDASVSEPTAEVVGHPQVSEDGSHVYFVARGVLSTGPNRHGQSAQPGANNLYVFERDAQYPGGRTVFIAALSADQAKGLWNGSEVKEVEPQTYVPQVNQGADLTPDGRFFLFTSMTDLTPDDTSTVQQVFEYDSRTGVLVRVSVGRGGFNDNGNTALNGAAIVSPSYERRYVSGEYASGRSLSADGGYVFFQSSAGLTPEAFDHKLIAVYEVEGIKKLAYAMNIYEYHDGVVSLISDGRDVTNVFGDTNVLLLGTDESGGDVFFTTADQLVAQDTDDNIDVYDARVGGGFSSPSLSPGCSGEACQGQLSGAPTLLSPGSEFQAGGNPPLAVSTPTAGGGRPRSRFKPARCGRGMTRRHGRCVKRHQGGPRGPVPASSGGGRS